MLDGIKLPTTTDERNPLTSGTFNGYKPQQVAKGAPTKDLLGTLGLTA